MREELRIKQLHGVPASLTALSPKCFRCAAAPSHSLSTLRAYWTLSLQQPVQIVKLRRGNMTHCGSFERRGEKFPPLRGIWRFLVEPSSGLSLRSAPKGEGRPPAVLKTFFHFISETGWVLYRVKDSGRPGDGTLPCVTHSED